MRKPYTQTDHPNPKKIISWGLGIQSTALCLMSCFGDYDVPKMDAIITSDTGWELPATYSTMKYYKEIFEKHGIPVYIVSNGNIYNEILPQSDVNIPLWSKNGGAIARQCTGEYKIIPIRRKIREILGVNPLGYGRTRKNSVHLYMGISYDEATRMKDSDAIYIKNMYPLVDNKITRDMCRDYYKERGFPIPIKSSCVCCPFQNKERLKFIRDNYPDEWKKLLHFDNVLRTPKERLAKNGMTDDFYVSRYKKPIEEIELDHVEQSDEYTDVCDSGYCFI